MKYPVVSAGGPYAVGKAFLEVPEAQRLSPSPSQPPARGRHRSGLLGFPSQCRGSRQGADF